MVVLDFERAVMSTVYCTFCIVSYRIDAIANFTFASFDIWKFSFFSLHSIKRAFRKHILYLKGKILQIINIHVQKMYSYFCIETTSDTIVKCIIV